MLTAGLLRWAQSIRQIVPVSNDVVVTRAWLSSQRHRCRGPRWLLDLAGRPDVAECPPRGRAGSSGPGFFHDHEGFTTVFDTKLFAIMDAELSRSRQAGNSPPWTWLSGPASAGGGLELEVSLFCPVYAAAWRWCDRADGPAHRLGPVQRDIGPVDEAPGVTSRPGGFRIPPGRHTPLTAYPGRLRRTPLNCVLRTHLNFGVLTGRQRRSIVVVGRSLSGASEAWRRGARSAYWNAAGAAGIAGHGMR